MDGNSKLKVSMEERFTRLENAIVRREPARAKIQRVAHHLVRDGMHYEKHYSPRLMSLGPIHHGAPKLQLGEQFKQMWAAMYIRSTGQAPQSLHGRVLDNMEEVMKLFATDLFTTFSNFSDQGFGSMKEMICWTLFVDACALLQILENAELGEAYKMNVKVEQLNLVVQDVILLENQLPFPLLKLLWRDTDESSLIPIMKKFLRYYWDARTEEWEIMRIEPPTHLLDLLRSIMLPESRHPDNRDSIIYFHSKFLGKMLIHRNIMELKAAGIEVKSSNTPWPGDIRFSLGWLRSKLVLPEIVVNETTAANLLNLIAYEMCPDFENNYEINDFVSFLDTLINHPDDVKALRSEQIVLNYLGSDEEVVNLFTTISYNLAHDMGNYFITRNHIAMHFVHKTLPTWLALGYHTYFSNPWAIIAFLAAVMGLSLTFIQTWYAIHPPK